MLASLQKLDIKCLGLIECVVQYLLNNIWQAIFIRTTFDKAFHKTILTSYPLILILPTYWPWN